MVDTIQKMLLAKDNAKSLILASMEECIQKAIATQLEKSIPAIVEATVNHFMSNEFIDKIINTTIGTTVIKITGDNSTKELNETTISAKCKDLVVTQTPELDDQAVNESKKQFLKKYYSREGFQLELEHGIKMKKMKKNKKRLVMT
eukprot:7911327-Ditylum_brightwellii.AAC.1